MKRGALAATLLACALLSPAAPADESRDAGPAAFTWATASSSPRAASVSHLGPLDLELLGKCGVAEDGLMAVAKRLVERKAAGLSYLDLDGLVFALRSAGEPHVWPRAWIVSAASFDRDVTIKKMEAWRASFGDPGERRCGIASAQVPGGHIIAAIALDALADLQPLPVRARTGQWLELDAKLRVAATGAKVVIQGPSGQPRTVPTNYQNGRVRARFALDSPGAFSVQVLADVSTGPRPVLEAHVYADVEPPRAMPSLAAPGEAAGQGQSGSALLNAMVQALRREKNLPAVTRDTRLDQLALVHAQRMKDAHTVGHDIGDGDPAQRLQSAGLVAKEAGENVSHSESVRLAHRALWQSPSHRANLERASFTHVGVGVLDDPDGSVWACEIFATGLK